MHKNIFCLYLYKTDQEILHLTIKPLNLKQLDAVCSRGTANHVTLLGGKAKGTYFACDKIKAYAVRQQTGHNGHNIQV